MRIVVLGDAGVGKTSFVTKYISPDHFEERYIPTIGVDICNITLPNGNKGEVRDPAGHKEFLVRRDKLLYQNIDFAIVLFSLTSKTSWDNVETYIEKLPFSVPIVICGNKLDDKKNRKISTFVLNREFNLLKNEYANVISLFEMSAKENINVVSPFARLCSSLT